MSKFKRLTIFTLGILITVSLSLPPQPIAQVGNTPATAPSMDTYVAERGFYEPNGTHIADTITEKRADFDKLRDLAVKYAPMVGADPVLVVWWSFIETPVEPYTYNNCHNNYRDPDYVCTPEMINGRLVHADDWQIAYGQQFGTAYEHLTAAYEAVYGNPNDRQKVQQVIQDVISNAGLSLTAPSTLTVDDIRNNAEHGESNRLWALLLSRDPAISVYLLSTALIFFNREEAFGYPGTYYQTNWQNFSNALNDVIEAWGNVGAVGSNGSGSGFGPTEPPIKLEVPDCPGVVREINAYNLPPSIYPKPNCGSGTPGNGTNGPTGVCTTDPSIQAYGTGEGAPPDGSIFWTFIGSTTGSIGQGFGPTDFAINDDGSVNAAYDDYDHTLNVVGHPGVDVDSEVGTRLFTPVAGTVITDGGTPYFIHDPAGRNAPYTGELKIELENGDHLIIGHMSQIEVRVGDQLQAGDFVGLSGESNGPHLHIEYRLALEHPQGSHTALDPRDVFGCASPSSTPTDTPEAPPDGESGPTVQGLSTTGGQVLQESSTVSPRYAEFQSKYGFLTPTGPSGRDFEQYADNFAVERDLAVKYAPEFNIEPEMVVWWTWFETDVPFDSWHYQNCLNDTDYPLDQECGAIGSGDWQVGYGQQYAMGMGNGLKDAFEKTHGDPNDAALVQKVGQHVLTNTGLSYTMPAMTIDQLMANESANRRWIFTLQRDQAISVYLTAKEIRQDLDGRPNMNWAEIMAQWSSSYYGSEDIKQLYSNIMNDVLLNWGIVGSGVTGQVCTVGTSVTTSNCSSMPDELNGLSTEEFVRLINQSMDGYKEIARCANVPWEMMAAIHLREVSLDPNYSGNNGGPWQLDPPPAGVDAFDFIEAGCWAAKHLAGKIEEQFAGEGLGPLRLEMDPSTKEDEYSIKAAFFGYNGTGRASWEQNIAKGCTPALDGNEKFNWDCSAYVMNNMDANHTDMCILGSIDGGTTQNYCDGNDGTWKVYYKLHYSTFGQNGELLVYGGNCNMTNEVIGGYSAPTKAGKQITSQFFAPSHEGIDIANVAGDPVFAFSDGEIITSGWSDMGGYYTILHLSAKGDQPEMWVYYGHLDPSSLIDVHGVPVKVVAGQEIAKTGTVSVKRPDGSSGPNGMLTGEHLHFDIRLEAGDPPTKEGHVDPCTFDVMVNSYPTLNCPTPANESPTP